MKAEFEQKKTTSIRLSEDELKIVKLNLMLSSGIRRKMKPIEKRKKINYADVLGSVDTILSTEKRRQAE